MTTVDGVQTEAERQRFLVLGICCVSVIELIHESAPPGHVHARVREAAHVCPSGAIVLTE